MFSQYKIPCVWYESGNETIKGNKEDQGQRSEKVGSEEAWGDLLGVWCMPVWKCTYLAQRRLSEYAQRELF